MYIHNNYYTEDISAELHNIIVREIFIYYNSIVDQSLTVTLILGDIIILLLLCMWDFLYNVDRRL